MARNILGRCSRAMMRERDPDAATPTLSVLGDRGLVVRFGSTLSDDTNGAAIAFARRVRSAVPAGVEEIQPNLVSVLLRYDPRRTSFEALAGEVRLLLSDPVDHADAIARHTIEVAFGGEGGPDLAEVASTLGLSPEAFIAAHNSRPLRVLATGFAPGFVYCGFHNAGMVVPRRIVVRPEVPAGTVLFAAGQTAVTATPIPTGWHVIGRTGFSNFDPGQEPPSRMSAGDTVTFTEKSG